MKEQIPHKLEEYRVTDGPMATEHSQRFGAFIVPLDALRVPDTFGKAQMIANPGGMPGAKGWDHVSVTIRAGGTTDVPGWRLMTVVKELFFEPDEPAYQYHPPDEEYVNCHPDVLHLWHPIHTGMPRPPSDLVGPRMQYQKSTLRNYD